MPDVSIVIPCYRGERFLAAAIESCLRQTYRELEVIVVDDASPDGCAAIADRYVRADPRVRLLRRARNGGVSRAFNSGFRAARGQYFSRLAQDDLFREDAVALMRGHLEKQPGTALAYCDFQTVNEAGDVTGVRTVGEPAKALSGGNSLGLCVLWRRYVWDELGGFDPSYDTAEDYEYWLRLARHYPISKCAGEAPFFVRIHPAMGSARFATRQELATAYARATHCGNPLQARRLRSAGHFEAAYAYRGQAQSRLALRHLLAAILSWPLAVANYRCLAGLVLDQFQDRAELQQIP